LVIRTSACPGAAGTTAGAGANRICRVATLLAFPPMSLTW